MIVTGKITSTGGANRIYVAPSYNISVQTFSIQEQTGNIIYTINTERVPDGTILYWTNSGTTQAEDFYVPSGPQVNSGSFTITNSLGQVTISTAVSDLFEGTETVILNVRTQSVNGPIVATAQTVNLIDAAPSYNLIESAASGPESRPVTYTLNARNVPENTVIYWEATTTTLTALTDFDSIYTTSGDVQIGNPLQGTIVIQNGSASLTRTFKHDDLVEVSETYTINFRTGSNSGPIVASTNYTVTDQAVMSGQAAFTTPGSYSWQVPGGVYRISAVVIGAGGGSASSGSNIGGGGGAGGALRYITKLIVFPGEILTVTVGSGGGPGLINSTERNGLRGGDSSISRGGTILLFAQGGAGGTISGSSGIGGALTIGGTQTAQPGPYAEFSGDVRGCNGGAGGSPGFNNGGGGGGGAGGYNSAGGGGGNGGNGNNSAGIAGGVNSGSAGGGGGSQNGGRVNNGGGGVGIFGIGVTGGSVGIDSAGQPGSGGTSGTSGNGGLYGGGGGATEDDFVSFGGSGGGGAVRIVWGPGREYPNAASVGNV